MPDPLTGPIPTGPVADERFWAVADPPIYQQTVAALGYRPTPLMTRVFRDVGIGVSRAGMEISAGFAVSGFIWPRNVWLRFNRACRQSGIENPLRPTAYRAELDAQRDFDRATSYDRLKRDSRWQAE